MRHQPQRRSASKQKREASIGWMTTATTWSSEEYSIQWCDR